MFVDDKQLYYRFVPSNVTATNKVLNNDHAAVYKFSQSHCLSLNTHKFVVILLNNSLNLLLSSLNLHIKCASLRMEKNVIRLGLILDESLRFNQCVTKCIYSI